MTELKFYFELLAQFATFVGFPLAFIIFLKQKKEDRKQNHLESYSSVDEKFFEFLRICSENPQLNCSLYSNDSIELNNEQHIQRISIYEMLICVFERVHIFYSYKLKSKRMADQESGWESYIKKWFGKKSFSDVWDEVKDTYDSEFKEYMEKIKKKITVTNNV